MSVTRVMVVDDEPPARRHLKRMLERLEPGVEVVLARDVEQVKEQLECAEVDAVFLGVQTPVESGVMLSRALRRGPPVVFVTAYRDFAVDAFEVRAVDYLIKPIDPERLADALERVRAADARPVYGLRGLNGVRFVTREQILCVCGRGDYTEVWLADGTSELVAVTMYEWEERLGGVFFRAHRSSLVRLDSLVAMTCSLSGSYTLEVRGVREPVKISRRAASELKGRFLS